MSAWDDAYQHGTTPWDSGHVDPIVAAAVEAGALPAGRLLEIGCGTGTHARFFAEHGWDVVATDLSPTAIERARAQGGDVDYRVLDVLREPLPEGPFDAVFDRGCWHVFDPPAARAHFARSVAGALRVGGRWLSLIGSTEGPPRDGGPPRRSLADIAQTIEPSLAIVALRSVRADEPQVPIFWSCLSERRDVPAQPSTRRER